MRWCLDPDSEGREILRCTCPSPDLDPPTLWMLQEGSLHFEGNGELIWQSLGNYLFWGGGRRRQAHLSFCYITNAAKMFLSIGLVAL